jgi:hypothetical protein
VHVSSVLSQKIKSWGYPINGPCVGIPFSSVSGGGGTDPISIDAPTLILNIAAGKMEREIAITKMHAMNGKHNTISVSMMIKAVSHKNALMEVQNRNPAMRYSKKFRA